MHTVLNSIQVAIKNSKYVQINEPAILAFSRQVEARDINGAELGWEALLPKTTTEDERIALPFVYNTVNFCYWGNPKWAVNIDGISYDGGVGMLQAVKHAIKRGFNILDPNYLANLSQAALAAILRGNVEIPFFKERLDLLRALGQGILTNYEGSFAEVVRRAGGSATRIVELLAKDFPTVFNDVTNYQGQTINFYKRAQLVPAHLFDLAKLGLISIPLTGYDELTAFADYKVPQSLRSFGILEYDNGLADRIDRKIEIPSGSDEEIEIRAHTIWAIELTTRVLRKRLPDANAAKVDDFFWFKGQTKSSGNKPYHLTKTIWY